MFIQKINYCEKIISKRKYPLNRLFQKITNGIFETPYYRKPYLQKSN